MFYSWWSLLIPRTEELHVNAMQRYALAAHRDGLDIPTIKTLASLATWGRHQSNSERDFHRVIPFLYNSEFPTYNISIDIFDPDEGIVKPIEVPVLLVSTVLHEIHKKDNKTLWDCCIGATAEKTHQFWTAFRSDRGASPWKHPVLETLGVSEWFSHIGPKDMCFFVAHKFYFLRFVNYKLKTACGKIIHWLLQGRTLKQSRSQWLGEAGAPRGERLWNQKLSGT